MAQEPEIAKQVYKNLYEAHKLIPQMEPMNVDRWNKLFIISMAISTKLRERKEKKGSTIYENEQKN